MPPENETDQVAPAVPIELLQRRLQLSGHAICITPSGSPLVTPVESIYSSPASSKHPTPPASPGIYSTPASSALHTPSASPPKISWSHDRLGSFHVNPSPSTCSESASWARGLSPNSSGNSAVPSSLSEGGLLTSGRPPDSRNHKPKDQLTPIWKGSGTASPLSPVLEFPGSLAEAVSGRAELLGKTNNKRSNPEDRHETNGQTCPAAQQLSIPRSETFSWVSAIVCSQPQEDHRHPAPLNSSVSSTFGAEPYQDLRSSPCVSNEGHGSGFGGARAPGEANSGALSLEKACTIRAHPDRTGPLPPPRSYIQPQNLRNCFHSRVFLVPSNISLPNIITTTALRTLFRILAGGGQPPTGCSSSFLVAQELQSHGCDESAANFQVESLDLWQSEWSADSSMEMHTEGAAMILKGISVLLYFQTFCSFQTR